MVSIKTSNIEYYDIQYADNRTIFFQWWFHKQGNALFDVTPWLIDNNQKWEKSLEITIKVIALLFYLVSPVDGNDTQVILNIQP